MLVQFKGMLSELVRKQIVGITKCFVCQKQFCNVPVSVFDVKGIIIIYEFCIMLVQFK